MVYSITSSDDFGNQIRSAGNKVVLLDFYANWCGPCKTMDPIVKSLEKKYGDKALVIKINVSKFAHIADVYNVHSLPTFVFLKSGKRVEEIIGANDVELKKKMSKLC